MVGAVVVVEIVDGVAEGVAAVEEGSERRYKYFCASRMLSAASIRVMTVSYLRLYHCMHDNLFLVLYQLI